MTHRRLRSLPLLGALLVSLTFTGRAHAQGCVVAHGSGLPAPMAEGEASSPWELSVSYRWFQSDRHYVGTVEQKQRQAEGSQVINRSNFTDLGIAYALSPRASLTLTIPYVAHDRSSVVRDDHRVILERYHTQASGLADVQVGGNYWLWQPTAERRGNLQLGAGLVLPTGRDDVTDVFESYDATTHQIVAVTKTVDQSIQPGSGGYGINLNAYGYRHLGAGFTGFVNGSYTITPQTDNGVHTYRGGFEEIMSIPDTYLGRMGVEYLASATHGISLSLGGRIEGVTVYDLFGGSTGFRRPGYSIAVEPGISIARARWSARLYVPVAVSRNRLQSEPDKLATAASGTYKQGDAAFADYLVMLSVSCRL